MKLLNGSELAGFIKERQTKQVRALKQSHKIFPRLAIVQEKDDPVINTYVRLKKTYGADIGVGVDIHKVNPKDTTQTIRDLNVDESIHGIIVQLPLEDEEKTEVVLNTVDSKKDVDGLAKKSFFDPATPTAIMWLLAGYNVDLAGKEIAIVGKGRLVGSPLARMFTDSNFSVSIYGRDTQDLTAKLNQADIIVSATGKPGLIIPDMIKQGAIVVDAGTSSEKGKTVGDLHPNVYEREDLTVTPQKGGVGPLTVCALFENVIKSASP